MDPRHPTKNIITLSRVGGGESDGGSRATNNKYNSQNYTDRHVGRHTDKHTDKQAGTR